MMEDGNFNLLQLYAEHRDPKAEAHRRENRRQIAHIRETFRYRMICGSRPRYSRSGFHDVVSCSTFLQAVLGSSDLAHHVVENCEITASRNPPRFEGEGAFRSWLVRILIDEALAIVRERTSEMTSLATSPDLARR